jgi:hypothetical protein
MCGPCGREAACAGMMALYQASSSEFLMFLTRFGAFDT